MSDRDDQQSNTEDNAAETQPVEGSGVSEEFRRVREVADNVSGEVDLGVSGTADVTGSNGNTDNAGSEGGGTQGSSS